MNLFKEQTYFEKKKKKPNIFYGMKEKCVLDLQSSSVVLLALVNEALG